ncbi:hypothetical protein LCGC14_1410790 [marine sediment metagenome]|uniref:Uncharacterized protein n=1 Tax=marine sediment metagenome TaxID=412755 RepID=A0A0F9M9R3_9ZZZZ
MRNKIPQKPIAGLWYLLKGYRLLFFRLDATDEEVYEEAQLTYADEFAQKLDQTYNEIVGEGGVVLS